MLPLTPGGPRAVAPPVGLVPPRRERPLSDDTARAGDRSQPPALAASSLPARSRDSPKRSSDAARQQASEELEWTPASASSKRVRVYVAAAHYNVVGAQSIKVTETFGQNAPELLVVALTCRLLVVLHRVAAEHAAAPSSAFETPALQALPVIELDYSID